MRRLAEYLRSRSPEERRRLVLLGVSTALFVFAAIVGTQPWWTGGFTWWQQRQLEGQLESVPSRAPVASATIEATRPPSAWDGWAHEDIPYWRRLADGKTFARLRIPKMGLNVLVVKGTSKADLEKGPGWLTGTDLPGPKGNTVISGHRTTFLAPFRHLDRLKPGDVIRLESPYREYRYRVVRAIIVRPSDKVVTRITRQPTLTLSACHPPYSARFRLIVQATLTRMTRREAENPVRRPPRD